MCSNEAIYLEKTVVVMLQKYLCLKLVFFRAFVSTTMSGKSTSSHFGGFSKEFCTKPKCNGIQIKVLAFDFDKTCTTEAILDIYKARDDYSRNTELLDQEWTRVVDFYSATMKDILQPLKETKTRATQFEENGLRHFLSEVKNGDNSAVDELISSNLLKGITSVGLEAFAKNVEIMPGLLAALKSFEILNLSFHVISLNFSARLIHHVLNRDGTLPTQIHANKLDFNDNISTGKLDKKFVSAFDKEITLAKIIENSNNSGVTIYIGDAFTDLLALLKADIGIIIGQSTSMLKVCNDFGIHVVPLHEWSFENLNHLNSYKTLYSVSNWTEIQNFVFSEIK